MLNETYRLQSVKRGRSTREDKAVEISDKYGRPAMETTSQKPS
jgi:hypothetical protein